MRSRKHVVGSVEGDGQMGTHRLGAEVGDARNDARRRDGHARFGDGGAFHQEPHRADEVLIVQKRLALPHEDQIDPVATDFDLLVVENQKHLADNFPGAEVALHAQQRGHAELAVHSASGLGGEADGGSPVGRRCAGQWRRGRRRVGYAADDAAPAAGAGLLGILGAIAVGHPDGFHRLPVGEADQVTDCAVARDKALVDGGKPSAVAFALPAAHAGTWAASRSGPDRSTRWP